MEKAIPYGTQYIILSYNERELLKCPYRGEQWEQVDQAIESVAHRNGVPSHLVDVILEEKGGFRLHLDRHPPPAVTVFSGGMTMQEPVPCPSCRKPDHGDSPLAALIRTPPPDGRRWSLRKLARVLGVSHATVAQALHDQGLTLEEPDPIIKVTAYLPAGLCRALEARARQQGHSVARELRDAATAWMQERP